MWDKAIDDTQPAIEGSHFFGALFDGLVKSSQDVANLVQPGCGAAAEDDHDHDHVHPADEKGHAAEAAASFTDMMTSLFFSSGRPPEVKAEKPAETKFSSFAGLTFGTDMSAGIVKDEVLSNGDKVQTRNTVTADLTLRAQKKTTNAKGKLIEESDSSKSVDGSAWSNKTRFDAAGKIIEKTQAFEDDDYNYFSSTVEWDKAGNAIITRDSYSFQFGDDQQSFKFTAQAIKDAQALLGKNKQGEDLLTKLGNGEPAFGLLVLQDLGNGDIQKGLAALSRFGKTSEEAMDRLATFGSGSAQEATMRLFRVGAGNTAKALELLEKFGEGSLEKGMYRLEQMGGLKGNAGVGLSIVEELAKGYDFETAVTNLVDFAKANGGKTVDDGIKFIQALGRGNHLEGARAARCMGDGDPAKCPLRARILSGTDSKEGFQFLINELGKKYGALHVLENMRRLHKDKTVEGGLESCTLFGGGNCRHGATGVHNLGVDREGEKDIKVGVDTVFLLNPAQPGQVVDPQQALMATRTTYGSFVGPDGNILESEAVAVDTLLKATRDKAGTVSGADVAPAIAGLSEKKDLEDGKAILRMASVNGLISEGVDNFLGLSDDKSFRSSVGNITLASDDGTVRNGVLQIQGFSNDGKSFPGGTENIRRVNRGGTNEANIRDVSAFADPGSDGVRRFSGGSLNLHGLNPEKTVAENIDEVILTSDKNPAGIRTFTGGRENIELVNPKQTISQNVQEIVLLADPNAQGKKDFTGGRLNLERINPLLPTSVNIAEVKLFGDPNPANGGERDFAGGRLNIQGINLMRPISANVDSIIGASDVPADGVRTFAGGRHNIELINPGAPISANTQEIVKFGDARDGVRDFDGGIGNLQSVNPAKPLSFNIGSVIAASDKTEGVPPSFAGGRNNIELVNRDAPISANIQELIKFDDRRPAGQVQEFDGGIANLRRVDPTREISFNIVSVQGFSDNENGVAPFTGGRTNLERLNPAQPLSVNIGSVIAFGDANEQGIKTFTSGSDNIKAIDPKAPVSRNVGTVVAFSDKVDGVGTFEGGTSNIRLVNPAASIGENIQRVANFNDKPTGRFEDGAVVLSRMSDASGNISTAIQNVHRMSDQGSFDEGASNIRTVGAGSIGTAIENLIKLGQASTTPPVNAGDVPGANRTIAAGALDAGITAVRAAGDGSVVKGIQAIITFGADNTFGAGMNGLIAAGAASPTRIEALAIAGNGRLADGLQRIQQYGGFEKLAGDHAGDVIEGAKHLRQISGGEPVGDAGKGDSQILRAQTQASVLTQQTQQAQQVAQREQRLEQAEQAARVAVAQSAAIKQSEQDDKLKEQQRINILRQSTIASLTVAASESATAHSSGAQGANSSGANGGVAAGGGARSFARMSDDQTSPLGGTGIGGAGSATGGTNAARSAFLSALAGSAAGNHAEIAAAKSAVAADVTAHRVDALLKALETSAGDPRSARATSLFDVKLAAMSVPLEFSTRHYVAAAGVQLAGTGSMVHMSDSRHIGGAVTAYQMALNLQTATAASRMSASAVDAVGGRVSANGSAGANANAGVFTGKYVKGQEVTPAGGSQVSSVKNSLVVALNVNGQSQPMDVRITRYPTGSGEGVGRTQQFVHVGRLPLRSTKKLALIGPEIALAALLISAGVARMRGVEHAQQAAQLTLVAEHMPDDDLSLADANLDAQSQIHVYEPRIRPTWLVRPDEDLCMLADHLFHDPRVGWLIADLNRSQINEMFDGAKRVVEMRVRQKIELPVWQDLVQFHKMRVEFRPEDLITVVTETAVDTQLMQLTLAPVIGVAGGAMPGTPALPGAAMPGVSAVDGVPAAAFPAAARIPALSVTASARVQSAQPLDTQQLVAASAMAKPIAGFGRLGKLFTLPALNAARVGNTASTETKQDPTAVATAADTLPEVILTKKYA